MSCHIHIHINVIINVNIISSFRIIHHIDINIILYFLTPRLPSQCHMSMNPWKLVCSSSLNIIVKSRIQRAPLMKGWADSSLNGL